MPANGGKRWGWYQLERGWAERLVADADIRPGELVVDVGAGLGALTAPLVAAGAIVIAVELHPERVALLRRRFAGVDDVIVVRADATDLRLPRRPFRVLANPPFGATSALLRRLLAPGSRLRRADLVVARQAARRWASPGAPGAGRWSQRFRVSMGPGIPRAAFHPRPTVDSALLVVTDARGR